MRDADSMTSKRLSVAILAVCLCVLSLPVWAAGSPVMSKPIPGLSIYNITSLWTTQDGKPVRLESLRGHLVIVAMIYLNCPDVCPLIAENMEQIEADLPKALSSRVAFALFTFDSARDSPAKLKAYAEARHLDTNHWTLFQSDDMATRELAAALDVTYRKKDDGNFDHSVVIALLDTDGVVAYRQLGLSHDTRAFVSKIRTLDRGVAK
jgi:protein SCO1